MLIKTSKKRLTSTQNQEMLNASTLELIAPELELLEITLLKTTTLKLITPKLNFSKINFAQMPLEILKIKGNNQKLEIETFPHTLKFLYIENVELLIKTCHLPFLWECILINCDLEEFEFSAHDLPLLTRLVLDDNKLTQINRGLFDLPTLNHFSLDNNPLKSEFLKFIQEKFPHRF